MRIASKIAAALTAATLAVTLVACGGPTTFEQTLLDEAEGIKVVAQNADTNSSATSEGVLTLEEGDVIVISPNMENGSFHLTITSEDGKNTVYDDDASGRIMFSIEAEPGTYDVTTTGNGGTTGEMTVFVQEKEELEQQDEALEAALESELAEQESLEE